MLRRARLATTAIFFISGAVYAAWATRIPAVQERLDLSPGELGAAALGLEMGAVLGLPLGGVLVTRLGSRASLRAGFAFFPAALIGVAAAPALGALMFALCVMAAANSVVDVAMNAQGVELERRHGRPILSRLHAGHPLGLALGGLAGVSAAAEGVSVGVHLGVVAVAGLLFGLAATGPLVREPLDGELRAFARPDRRLLVLGLVAFCAFLLDGAACNWTAVHLSAEHGAGEGLAAAAFMTFALALAAGRLRGDVLVARFGRMHVVRGAGALAVAGAIIAIFAPGAAIAIAGWALFGLGLAPMAPTVLGAAAGAGGVSPPVAIAAVSTIGYLGSFTGSPLIGALAEVASLPAALCLLIAVGAATTLLARPALGESRPRLYSPDASGGLPAEPARSSTDEFPTSQAAPRA